MTTTAEQQKTETTPFGAFASREEFFAWMKDNFDKSVIQTHSGLEKGITVFKRPKDMDTAVTMADKLGTIRNTRKGAAFVKTTRRALTEDETFAIEQEVAACDRVWKMMRA